MSFDPTRETTPKLLEARIAAGDSEGRLIKAVLVLESRDLAILHEIRARVDSRHFSRTEWQAAWDVITQLADAGGAWAAHLVAPPLAKRLGWTLTETVDFLIVEMESDRHWVVAHISDYVTAIVRSWQQLQVATAIHAAAVALPDPYQSLAEITSKLAADCDAALATADDPLERASFRDMLERGQAETVEDSHPIPTGLESLDDLLTGGFRSGQLIFVGARPSMGKSALCQQIALRFAEQDCGVLNLSFEMGEAEVRKRWVAQLGMSEADPMDRERMSALPLWSPVCSGWSIDRVESETHRMVIRHQIRLLIVDHTLLLVQPSRHQREIDQVTDITRRLKILAQKLQLVVLAAHQFNRAKEAREGTERPRMSDFRASGSVEQDADILLGLHRYLEPGEGHIATLYVLKQRCGQTGDIPLDFNEAATRFSRYVPGTDF